MQVPAKVTFHEIDHSEAVETRIRERIAKLDRVGGRLTRCDVTVDSIHHRTNKSPVFRVRIDMTVPGREIAISHDPKNSHQHEDVYMAIRDAFDAAERRLKDYNAKRRGD